MAEEWSANGARAKRSKGRLLSKKYEMDLRGMRNVKWPHHILHSCSTFTIRFVCHFGVPCLCLGETEPSLVALTVYVSVHTHFYEYRRQESYNIPALPFSELTMKRALGRTSPGIQAQGRPETRNPPELKQIEKVCHNHNAKVKSF